jgi:hypothetical protein
MKRALLLLLAGCDASAAYLYTANVYDPQRDCVSSTQGIDFMEGTDPGSGCGAKCLAANDGGLPVYVTTMCGPAPMVADVSGSNPACSSALAAFARSDICLDGGGSTNPPDASIDASVDGGTD